VAAAAEFKLVREKPPTLRVMREEEWSKSEAQRQAGDEPPRLKGFRLR